GGGGARQTGGRGEEVARPRERAGEAIGGAGQPIERQRGGQRRVRQAAAEGAALVVHALDEAGRAGQDRAEGSAEVLPERDVDRVEEVAVLAHGDAGRGRHHVEARAVEVGRDGALAAERRGRAH